MTTAWIDDGILLSFDGTVIEAFGVPERGSVRFHHQNVKLIVKDPDRKGRRMVQLIGGAACAFLVPEDRWSDLAPLLDTIATGASMAAAR